MVSPLSFVLIVLFLLTCDAKKPKTARLEQTIATDIPCLDTPQCLSVVGNAWCQSGLICVKGFCHRIPNTPCNTQAQTCDDENRVCVAKSCLVSEDCDDGLFCNGHEKCVNKTCIVDPKSKPPCRHGICNETARQCIHPVRLAHWRNYATNEAFSAQNGTHGVIGDSESRLMTGAILGLVIIVILFTLIFLMIALVNRNYTPIPTADASWIY